MFLPSIEQRRTFKDIITFIPVIIILIIPLSPEGHVLVFGAIQRFFPDFFPSCFTEQRQNLLQLYESTEYSEFTIKENFNVSTLCHLSWTRYVVYLMPSSVSLINFTPQQQFSRFLEAVAFSIASKTRNAFNNIANPTKDDE